MNERKKNKEESKKTKKDEERTKKKNKEIKKNYISNSIFLYLKLFLHMKLNR